MSTVPTPTFTDRAKAYDEKIDWSGRFARELPVFREVFGSPTGQRLLDAGCGPGRHAVALARQGYSITGADISADMIDQAARHAADQGAAVTWVRSPFAQLGKRCPGPFDGVLCVGNALAAAGTPAKVKTALKQVHAVLRPGGKAFIQVLNFPPMRAQSPYVVGPRAYQRDGVEHLSIKVFNFVGQRADVRGITLFKDTTWQKRTFLGRLCAMSPDQMRAWLTEAGLPPIHLYGDYARTSFDPQSSKDLIIVAERPA